MNVTVVEIATLVTVFSALLTAIYTSPEDKPYGAWDLLLSTGVIVFCFSFRTSLQKSPLFLMFARVGISIAAMLIVMTICQAISKRLVEKINKPVLRILDGQFLITVLLFGSSWLWY